MKNRIHRITTWFSSRKLKQKVRSLFVMILCIYFLILILVYIFVVRGDMKEYAREANHNMLASMSSNLETVIANVSTVSKWIMNSREVRTYLTEGSGDLQGLSYDALSKVYDFTISEQYVSSIYIFRNDGKYIDISNGRTVVDLIGMKEAGWYQEVSDKAGAYLIRINGDGVFENQSGKPLISFIRMINDVQTQQPIGLLVMNYSTEILSSTYAEIPEERRSFGYLDEQGQVLCGAEMPEGFQQEKLPEKKGFYAMELSDHVSLYGYSIPHAPLTAVSYEKMDIYSYVSSQSIFIIVLFLVVTGSGLILIGLFISFYITKPVERLVQSMDSVKSGWLKRVSLNLPDDEIGHLKDSYNNMLVEVNRLIAELVDKETAIQKAEIEALQEQIKPHFLYNTLDTIGYLALEKPGEEVYDAIETLGNFYRTFLSKGSSEIPLRDEIQIVKNYLKLQALRYEDTFTDEYRISEKLLDIKVPKLFLQPLVENALYHGVRLKGERGLIRISAFEESECIFVSVYDTGVGMSASQIEGLMKEEGKSFGLRKTIERIGTYYGISDVYEIHSEEGYFCEVVIKIPLVQKEGFSHV